MLTFASSNISDMKTIENLLKDLDFLDMQKQYLAFGCGFYSESNKNDLFKNHHKFLIVVKISPKVVK